MKKVIRYLRFSRLGQSNGSIEAQQLCTDQWITFNNAELVDTFIDIGKSARTFDRPDFIRLQKFILKHYQKVDYLLVDQLDRFSRNAGEALTTVKDLQSSYGIQVVSATEGITFDYDTPGSFFRAGLQFLLAEEDNINRSIKIRKGLYTAKVQEGRHLHRTPPFGYRKNGIGKKSHLVIHEDEAKIVRFIYENYLHGMPLYVIKKEVHDMGFNRKSNMAVENILRNPVYAGLLKVEPFKEFPGGLFPGIHEPLIDKETWRAIQSKINKPIKERVILDEELPLRGVLKCHCGNPLTGAPSRSKTGRYFYYYKCRLSKHNNISAIKAHEQLLATLSLMRLPEQIINEIIKHCQAHINKGLRSNRLKIITQQELVFEIEKKLSAVEEKWIMNEISKDSFEKWYSEYSNKLNSLRESIEKLKYQVDKAINILEQNLDLLVDMKHIYKQAALLQKRELIRMIFDDNLYYENGIYKTPTLISALQHHFLFRKEGGYLLYEKSGI
ncbi:recombinase family protein [Pedobacter nutrimenti]|uniref:DNA invertase Pin-like site-specific DNA recombinase n=1 Tax=Pedobacter nutrimenti TaxID=1241337 RepID=A0A318U789_9SPHI|nr:recombinase family protein [Pedobacter nutrimenti]PYF68392.1 DNA invertase Pin-like site-specific DNA recombinase [Pedobacter nutrimenti]